MSAVEKIAERFFKMIEEIFPQAMESDLGVVALISILLIGTLYVVIFHINKIQAKKAVLLLFFLTLPLILIVSGFSSSLSRRGSTDQPSECLTDEDLEGKDAFELDIMRNEIYARHGRRFCRSDLQEYFDGQQWYEPKYCPEYFKDNPERFNDKLLTPMEFCKVKYIDEFQRAKDLKKKSFTSEMCEQNLPDCSKNMSS